MNVRGGTNENTEPIPSTSRGVGVPTNVIPQNTGARPKQPEKFKRQKQTINSISQSLDTQYYDVFEASNDVKEYMAKFTNCDGDERELTWTNQPPAATGRRRAQDVVLGPVKRPLGPAQNAKTPLEAWELFFDERIVSSIVRFTNQKIQRVHSQLPPAILEDSRYTYLKETNVVEVRAVFGLCYLRGALRVSKQNTRHLYGPDGHHAFGATMSMNRFNFVISVLSFDDPETREEQKKEDKFAVMRVFFEAVNKNCARALAPPIYLAIDETLYPTRGRCGFKQFMALKPERYGINFKSINSVEIPYTHSMVVAAGRPENEEGPHYTKDVLSTVQRLVTNLKKHVKLDGRNISMDNYYTKIDVAEWLLRNKITMVGTIQSNKKGVPKEIKDTKDREPNSYEPLWEKKTGKVSLHSYVVKTKSKGVKNVLVLSTFDPLLGLTKCEKRKPAINKFYDFTKGGTDIMDQRIGNYTTKFKSQKWIKVIIYYLLDTCCRNSQTIVCLNSGIHPRNSDSYEHQMALSKALITPQVEHRPLNRLSKPIQAKMAVTLGKKVNPQGQELSPEMENFPSTGNRRRCKLCENACDVQGQKALKNQLSKSEKQCMRCEKSVCREHLILLCRTCTELFTFQEPQQDNSDENLLFNVYTCQNSWNFNISL